MHPFNLPTPFFYVFLIVHSSPQRDPSRFHVAELFKELNADFGLKFELASHGCCLG
jgi:hypothetical protein